MNVRVIKDTHNAIILEIDPESIPTFGANGFIIRRSVLEVLAWKPYYFDIDVFQQAVNAGHTRIGIIKTEIRHLFCNNIATFRRKQARRIRDYYYHSKQKHRTYKYNSIPLRKYIMFVLETLTVLPLIWQSLRGYFHKPDGAWWFHPLACWITLWEYGLATAISFFGISEYNRNSWKQ